MSVQGLFEGQIVVGVDLGDDWENSLAHATQMARVSGSKVHLVHVQEEAGSSLRRLLDGEELKLALAQQAEQAQARLDQGLAQIPEDVRGEARLVEGNPSHEILAEAEKLGAGLIVVGAGVIEGSEHLIIGTTPDRLIRASKVPVLVVGRAAPGGYQHVVIPTDLDRADEGAIRLGCALAHSNGGGADVLHCHIIPSLLHRYMGNVAEMRAKAREKAEKHFNSYLDGVTLDDGCVVPNRVIVAENDETHPAEVIVTEANKRSADLIVMALGGISVFQRWFIGGVAEKILRALPCTLLALPTSWAEKH